MPNILAHYGVQGALTHALIKGAPPAWITVGGLMPDMPWLLVRMLKAFIPQPLLAPSACPLAVIPEISKAWWMVLRMCQT